MEIVVEGPDATGKSTLIDWLNCTLHRPVMLSEGPEKYPGEINERIRRYMPVREAIWDRHPCISQAIYCQVNGTTRPDPELVAEFYGRPAIFIYCRDPAPQHVLKEHDTTEHLEMLAKNKLFIHNAYDLWAVNHAHVIYRIGDVLRPIEAYIKERLHVYSYQSNAR